MSSAVKIFRLPFEGLLPGISLLVILEPSCKVIKEMLFRIVLSSVDHLPSRSAYIFFYENPWMFVPSPQCIAIPYTLCIWIFPLWPPDSVSPGFILRFCLLYTPFLSAHILCFSRLLLCFCRLIYSVSLLFNPFPCMEMPLLSCISKSIIHPSLFHFPHILSVLLSPSVAARHFFSVLLYRFHCALPSSFLPCSPLPHLVINRVLLPIPVLVGLLKAQ